IYQDGKSLAVACQDHTVRIFDVNTGTLRKTLNGHTNYVYCVLFSTGDKTLVSCSGVWRNPGQQGEIIVWDLASGKARHMMKTRQGGFVSFMRPMKSTSTHAGTTAPSASGTLANKRKPYRPTAADRSDDSCSHRTVNSWPRSVSMGDFGIRTRCKKSDKSWPIQAAPAPWPSPPTANT